MIAFIADLHLQQSNPQTLQQAVDFLRWAKGRCQELYILGDLFEYWLGDDCPQPGLSSFNQNLKELSDADCKISLMHGNRDFLVGENYCASVGATLLRADTLEIRLGQRTALLLHGDTLCTDDTDYQQARLQLRDREWQMKFTSLPFEVRRDQALALRRQSRDSSANKTQDIMDANPHAIDELCRTHKVDLIIHGHTHRPHWHNGTNHDRIVVGDWHDDGAYVALYDNSELLLKHWPFEH